VVVVEKLTAVFIAKSGVMGVVMEAAKNQGRNRCNRRMQ
jgi:hypothetical protein